MNTTSPTTTDPTAVVLDRAGDAIRFAGWTLFGCAAAAFLVVLVWRVSGGRRPGSPRWQLLDDGRIVGPRWRKWRIRRALRPLVHLGARHRPDTILGWHALGERLDARQTRRVRRAWPDLAAVLGWPSRFDAYAVGLDAREVLVGAGDDLPNEVTTTRRLDELGVIAHTSRAEIARLDDRPSLVRLTILDASAEAIETTLDVPGLRRNAFGVYVKRRVTVITGARWRSLYDPEIVWEDERDDVDAVSGATPPPTGGGPVSRWDTSDHGPDRTTPDAPDIAPPVRVPSTHLAVVELLAASGPLSSAAIARHLGRDLSNTCRTLARMRNRRLVVDAHGAWDLTPEAAPLVPLATPVAIHPEPAPWPAPTLKGDPS